MFGSRLTEYQRLARRERELHAKGSDEKQPHQKKPKIVAGFTLVELMIVLAIMAILLVFAVPSFQNTVDTTEVGVVTANIHTIEMFQEDFFLRNGAYANDLDNINEIEAAIGWNPRSDDGIAYSIAASDGTLYDVTAVSPEGFTVCIRFPAKQNCP